MKKCQSSLEMSLLSSECLNKVFNSIPDIIGVYGQDHEIIFLNQAGCHLYQVAPEKIKGKKCYELLMLEQKCSDCPFDNTAGTCRLKKRVVYRQVRQVG